MKLISIYTDGSCKGNPGPGGWAAIITGDHINTDREISGGEEETTNNRMELIAVIEGIREAVAVHGKNAKFVVYSDSQYVTDAINKSWIESWKKRNWKTAAKRPVANQDLWKELDNLIQDLDVVFNHIPGHAGITYNELADELASNQAELHASYFRNM